MSEAAEKNQSKSKRGGARPGSGRPKGRKSAKTLEIEAAAREYRDDALKALAHVMAESENDSARVSAANSLLDRGFGKPRQAVEHTGEAGGPIDIAVTHEVIDPQSVEN